ncbi:MAG: integrin alpha, partial [Polyangiales bacterium]
PVFSLPTLAQNVSAPTALGDLDADGCDEVGLRYADNNRSGLLVLFGYAASGGRCMGHTQPAWLRLSGDAEVGLANMQLGVASTRAGRLFGDERELVAISANLYPFEGSRQPTVLLFDGADLGALRPEHGERVVSALDPALEHWPLVYRERAPGFGRALAGNVDADGDGVVDLVVSAPGASLNGDGTGAVFVFRGQPALGGRMDPWLSVVGDPRERASFGQDISAIAATSKSPASVAIGAPLSYRTGTANGTAWLLQIAAPPE